MKLEKGDRIQVHGYLDIPLEDGFRYLLVDIKGQRYVFESDDTGGVIQVPYPAVDRHIGTDSFIERV